MILSDFKSYELLKLLDDLWLDKKIKIVGPQGDTPVKYYIRKGPDDGFLPCDYWISTVHFTLEEPYRTQGGQWDRNHRSIYNYYSYACNDLINIPEVVQYIEEWRKNREQCE